jgi:hypothetical protein
VLKALSVRQPWAWLIFNGKPVENRDWRTAHRGPLAIHAAKGMTRAEYEDAIDFVWSFDALLASRIPAAESLVRGHVIGVVTQTGCVSEHTSPFFQGKWGHVYVDAKPFRVPIEARGDRGLWEWDPPKRVLEQV